ncbi:MAG: DNA endonuclease SmrA [Bacterioplanes sp.]|nr:DNA endonuclease SmrA [Bacterioplanes sp.]
MSIVDDELFLQEMADVQPIAVTPRVTLRKGNLATANAAARQRAASADVPAATDGNPLATREIDRVGPHDVVGYKRPGIQDGVFRKLRLGKYETEARLDLHKRTVEQARNDVYRFIQECIEHDIRCVLMLPGKGDRNVKDPALLKSYLVYWLTELDDVHAFHTAQPHHGGSGAFYVLLRKSDRKKQLARERYSKGRL